MTTDTAGHSGAGDEARAIEWIDIDSPPGTKIVFDPERTHSYDRGLNSGLTVGATYTVKYTEISSFHTNIRLVEVDGKFNSTMFHKPLPASPAKAAQGADTLLVCASNQDGECDHPLCPQNRDGEPAKSGRSCPIYNWEDTRS